MSDVISRQVAISAICSACGKIDCDKMDKCEKLQLPPANSSEIPNSSDTISRAKAIDGKICIRRSNGVEIYDDYVVPVEYLEQLPPAQPEQLSTNLAEVGTDFISRQAAIDACGGYLIPANIIKQLPPAQPEPSQVAKDIARIVENEQDMRVIKQPERIRGRWIPVGGALYQCDQCGVVSLKRKFCFECGADMREVTE